jgi:hypothetical protein
VCRNGLDKGGHRGARYRARPFAAGHWFASEKKTDLPDRTNVPITEPLTERARASRGERRSCAGCPGGDPSAGAQPGPVRRSARRARGEIAGLHVPVWHDPEHGCHLDHAQGRER